MAFKNLDLNQTFDSPAPNYLLERGYCRLFRSISSLPSLASYRRDLDSLFRGFEGRDLHLHLCDQSSPIFANLLKLLICEEVSTFLDGLARSALEDEPVYLLPPFKIMRNYYALSSGARDSGWHTDAGLMLQGKRRSDIKPKSHIFGMLNVPFQENTLLYGGGVDMIPSSYPCRNQSNRDFIRKKIVSRLSSICYRSPLETEHAYRIESYLYSLIGARTLSCVPLNIYAWSNLIYHRSTPGVANLGKRSSGNPAQQKKYMMYINYGTPSALRAWIHDRSNRSGWSERKELWKSQFKDLRCVFSSAASERFDQACSDLGV